MFEKENAIFDEHFIPQFFIKHFYSEQTNILTNSIKGKVCCYRFDKKAPFNCFSDKICFEKNLYETAMINNDVKSILTKSGKDFETIAKYFENKFCEIEGVATDKFKKLFLLLDKSKHGDKVLSNKKIKFLTEYMLLQFFRLPQMLAIQMISLYNIKCKSDKKNYKLDINSGTMILHNVLKILLSKNSPTIKPFAEIILKTHDVCILKSTNNFSFFTSNIPVFFLGDITENENVFKSNSILFPISPKYCLWFINKTYNVHCHEHKKLVQTKDEFSNIYLDCFIAFVLQSSQFIFSNQITNETIERIKAKIEKLIKKRRNNNAPHLQNNQPHQ